MFEDKFLNMYVFNVDVNKLFCYIELVLSFYCICIVLCFLIYFNLLFFLYYNMFVYYFI